MKKRTALIIGLLLAISLTACGGSSKKCEFKVGRVFCENIAEKGSQYCESCLKNMDMAEKFTNALSDLLSQE